MMLRLSPNGEPQCWKSSNWPGEPSAAEREYAHRLALWGKLTLSGEAGEDSASRKARMLITLDQTRPQLFFDCVVEVLDVSVGARPFITVTDYTAHPCFDRENDALLHARLGFPPPEDVIPGDGGGRVFHITLFGAQRAATEVLRANKRYHLAEFREVSF
ncbi:hypothetical protein K437DRAFT_254238 [Tilletiaria anomala UBC 951]|uniref:Uncharacterized protein n=1 Tax=Tilletiaria anomala (strain ATCC 24038 / CBS 436.72 / UBC 951) TaxID=1037660 RepID=A0A066WPB1_TILAU|nr:uncharacterized protein K437DRAFT_254238 [Tilletiaria anomala UBC 951]KDN52460.1 hypothetical protein K437DRAFT_254238 [Tilletiaria anomala UBC 951]